MQLEYINSALAPQPVGSYSHATRFQNLLFLSGVGPRQASSTEIPGVQRDEHGQIINYDIERQCRATLDNIKTILEAGGSKWDNIIDVTVFLTNMSADFPIFNRIYSEYFRNHQPSRTTVEVNALPTSIAIEIKVIAYIE
jgi:2-aminomuconate deaminase